MTHSVAAPERILLVSLDSVGDLVFASALTDPLRAAYPDAAIDLWCKAYTAPLAPLIPHVRSIIAADTPWAHPRSMPSPNVRAFVRSVGEVRRGNYDVAVLSAAPWRTAAAVASTGIPMRVGLARHRNGPFLTHRLAAEDPHKPVVREQARLLESLGIHSDHAHYRLDGERLPVEAIDAAAQLPSRFVAFHPFASRGDRCVSLEEWMRAAAEMSAHGIAVLWVGTSRELKRVRASYTHPLAWYTDLVGDGSLMCTAAALSRASIFMGHDSGPLHIASGLGVPCVGIFAPGQPHRTFPQGAAPWTMVYRPTPASIHADTMLREMDELGLFSMT